MSYSPLPLEVTYVPRDEPLDLGRTRTTFGWYHPHLFGHYRVRLENGWVQMFPHTGEPGTVGAEPVDLHLNPEFAEFLVAEARRSEEAMQ